MAMGRSFSALPNRPSNRELGHTVEGVEGGELVGLGEGRVVEGVLDEVVDGAAEVEDGLSEKYELGGAFADDVGAEEFAALEVEDQLHQAAFDAHDVAARGLAETTDADLVVEALVAHLLLGHADGGDFRNGVEAIRKVFRRGGNGQAESVAGGGAALFHGGRGEAGEPDDVTGRIDVRHRRLVSDGITLQATAGVGFEAAGLEAEVGRSADATGGVEQHFSPDLATVAQGADSPAGGVVLDSLDLDAEAKLHAAFAQFVHEFFDDFSIDELEKMLARLDQGHRDVEGGEDGGVFEPDDSGADDGEAARDARIGGDVVAVEHRCVVE